jgi:hypothetical protein
VDDEGERVENSIRNAMGSTAMGPSCKWNSKNDWCWNETKI